MKVYKKNQNWEYLTDRGGSRAGTKLELKIEMAVWNFIARIVNKLTRRHYD